MKKIIINKKGETSNSNFFLSAKRIFLTYKKCSTNLNNKILLHSYLVKLFTKKKANLIDLITSYERSDSNHSYEHFHVYVEFDRKVKITSQSALDVNGIHGQYESVRNKKASINYVTKGGDYIRYGDEQLNQNQSSLNNVQIVTFLVKKSVQLKTLARYKKYHDLSTSSIINEAAGFLIGDSSPRYFLNRSIINKAVISMLDTKYPKIFKTNSYPLSSFKVPTGVMEWKRLHSSSKVLVLLGPSGMGKTELAKALFSKPLVVSHIDQLKELTPKHNCVILDDMNFSHLKTEDAIHLTDLFNERGINVKGDYAKLAAGLTRIITSNKDLQHIFPKDKAGAIQRRIYVVTLEVNAYVNKGSDDSKES